MIKLSIDFSKINNVTEFHDEMKELFGFPDFYGKNAHALIDCLTSLRYPEDGMTSINIGKDDYILLEVSNIKYHENDSEMTKILFSSIQFVNYRCNFMGDNPSILLSLTQSCH